MLRKRNNRLWLPNILKYPSLPFSRSAGGAPPPAFSPADFYAGSELGPFYNVADLSTMFTDTGGTTQAILLDAVARINDLSGNGEHLTQATSANRPILARHPASGPRNILVQTATLATQTRTVIAAQHTLSFQGTGTVTLSDASTAGPLVGTGPTDIVSLTFTPTAGNLTLTVTGTVELAQLEAGAARTGYQDVLDANGWNITEAGEADVYYLAIGGTRTAHLFGSSSNQFASPWEFWASISFEAFGNINITVFGKNAGPNSIISQAGNEGLWQRSDGTIRQMVAVSRVGSGTQFLATASNAFSLNTPFVAKAIASAGPNNLRASTPLATADNATVDFTGTPAVTSFTIGSGRAQAPIRFYGGFGINRNLTAPEAANADAWMAALQNP